MKADTIFTKIKPVLFTELIRHKSLRCLLLMLSVFLAACASPNPTPVEFANASFGPKPDSQMLQNALNDYGLRTLIDPTSAMYFLTSAPRKGWAKPDFNTVGHQNDPATFGWVFTADINSRNRLGGYVGRRSYVFLYRGGMVYSATDNHTNYGTPINCPFGYID